MDANKRRYEQDLVEDLKQRGLGKVALVGNSNGGGDIMVRASAWNLPDSLRTPFEVVFAQLLAYHLSVHARVNPDDPSPHGTITRVVKPFSIHPDNA